MTKEEIQKNSEHWYNKYKEVKHELEQERKLNAEIKARFVKCNTCTDEMKSKCLMFSENLCEGERCEELVDLMALVSKSDLQKENEQLKQQIEKMRNCGNCNGIIEGGIRTKKCKICMSGKDLSQWELEND